MIQPERYRLFQCSSDGVIGELNFSFPCQSIYAMDTLEQNLEVIKTCACIGTREEKLNEEDLSHLISRLHPDFLQMLQADYFEVCEKDQLFCQEALLSTHTLILIELFFHALYLDDLELQEKCLKEIQSVYPKGIEQLFGEICKDVVGLEISSLDEYHKEVNWPAHRLLSLQKLKSWLLNRSKDKELNTRSSSA